jgi:hypothetical protein
VTKKGNMKPQLKDIFNLSAAVALLDVYIERLNQARDLLTAPLGVITVKKRTPTGKLSASGKKKIAEAQRKRWAEQKRKARAKKKVKKVSGGPTKIVS